MLRFALRRAHNIHVQHVDVDKAARSALKRQKACVLWLTGLSGAGKSMDKVVTERITRTAANRIEYSATVVDTSTFQDRIELSFPMTLVNAQIHEGGCHEGNYSMRNSLYAARLDDAAKAKEAAAKDAAAKK